MNNRPPNNDPYRDILHLPHPVSRKHPPMPLSDRAAQFLPFAALTGYDDALLETARLTDEQIHLDESCQLEINKRLLLLLDSLGRHPTVTITCFQPDAKKSGGAYITVTGTLKKIDQYDNSVLLTDGSKIRIEDILELDSDLFNTLDS